MSNIYKTAVEIRALENKLLELFEQNELFGTVHTCIGQEFCATTLHRHLNSDVDAVFASHRGHGHYIAYGGPTKALFAELMGRQEALCLGRGGTQQLQYKQFFSSGIQGGVPLLGTGCAWAIKRKGTAGIAVAQIGDGTLGEGALYEAFTFASLLQVPILFLLEWNGYAQSTDTTLTTPGNVVKRIEGFGIETDCRDDKHPEVLSHHLGNIVERVRSGIPFVQIIETRRLMAHSKGDDERPKKIKDKLWTEDPLRMAMGQREELKEHYQQTELELTKLVSSVKELPPIDSVYSSTSMDSGREISSSEICSERGRGETEYNRVAQELNQAFHDIMYHHQEVILLGEDVADPYGGTFKVSKGLSTQYPDQVFSTPIAEAGIVGIANGLALAGLRPVAEIMFADFVTLAADQIVNHSAKFKYIYGDKVSCPLTVRLPSGGGRGYGPTHSQSLERLFYGIPGLRLLTMSHRHHPGYLFKQAVFYDDNPTLFIENKVLYGARPKLHYPLDLKPCPTARSNGDFPPLRYKSEQDDPDVTVVTHGGIAETVEEAMRQVIIEEELCFEYIILTQIWPLTIEEVVESVQKTGRIVVIEENSPAFAIGSAVVSQVVERIPCAVSSKTVGAEAVPIPAARHLEAQVLPTITKIFNAIMELVGR